ncbi:MAG: hypothetical protein ACM3X7_05630 [Solirubrobacterales bacterium]
MRQYAGFFGSMIVIFYGLTILNFILKWVNKKYPKIINKNKQVKMIFKKSMKIVVKYHKLFGILTIIFLGLHFWIFYSNGRISRTGILAALLMISQVVLGILGAYVIKKRTGLWFSLHRVLAAALALVIFIHTS